MTRHRATGGPGIRPRRTGTCRARRATPGLAVAASAIALLGAGQAPAVPSVQPPALGQYLVGSYALTSDNFGIAADSLLRALAADPGDRSIRRRAYLAAALAGRPEAVRIASGLPDDPAARLTAANSLAVQGRWEEAIHAYGDLPHDQGVTDLMRPILVAWAEAGASHPSAALATLAPFIQGSHLPALYALHAAMIADQAGDVERAATDYRLAQDESPGLTLDLVRLLASFAERQGHADEANALIQALESGSPLLALAGPGIAASVAQQPVQNAREGIAHAYLGVATLMLSQRAHDAGDASQDPNGGDDTAQTGALLMLRDSLVFSPLSSEARLALADVEQTLGNLPAARAALAPVVASDPLIALVRVREAQLAALDGDAPRALELYRGLVAAKPGQQEPWREMGELLSDQGRYAEAVTAFGKALASIAHPAGSDWSLYFDQAVAYDRSGHWDLADKDLHEALALSPEQPFVLNYLGYSYAERDLDLGAARRMLASAIDQQPHDGAFLDSLGWIELKQGDVAQAIDTLQRAAELTPVDATVNYHLGCAYWQAGRHAEARQEWQQAMILDPDATERPKIEARLRESAASAPSTGAADHRSGTGQQAASP